MVASRRKYRPQLSFRSQMSRIRRPSSRMSTTTGAASSKKQTQARRFHSVREVCQDSANCGFFENRPGRDRRRSRWKTAGAGSEATTPCPSQSRLSVVRPATASFRFIVTDHKGSAEYKALAESRRAQRGKGSPHRRSSTSPYRQPGEDYSARRGASCCPKGRPFRSWKTRRWRSARGLKAAKSIAKPQSEIEKFR